MHRKRVRRENTKPKLFNKKDNYNKKSFCKRNIKEGVSSALIVVSELLQTAPGKVKSSIFFLQVTTENVIINTSHRG